jgi:hypothetical protein
MGSRLRELRPAAAWRETERRAIAVGIVGFFTFGLLQSLGVPILQKPIQAAIAGMVASFLTLLAVSVAYYHRSWVMGALSAACFSFPFGALALWSRISNQPLLIPGGIVGLAGYLALKRLHISASKQIADTFYSDLVQADESEFQSQPHWSAIAFLVTIVLGAIVMLILLR